AACAVLDRLQGLRLAADDFAEMIELGDIGIERIGVNALRLDRLVPALRIACLRPLHEGRKLDRTAAAEEAVAALAAERKFGGFAEPLLGRPGRDGAVADEEGAERAAVELDQRRSGVLDRKAALTVRRDRFHRDDLAHGEAQEIDLMDQVDQDRTAAGLRAPWRYLEIGGRLVRGPDRRHPDDIADPPFSQHRAERPDLLMVAAVMPDQRLD